MSNDDCAKSVTHPTIKRPPAHWTRLAGNLDAKLHRVEVWTYSGIVVTSQLAKMAAPDGSGDVIPQWLVAISKGGRHRASDADVARALRAFGMEGAEEDNHHPGVSRSFFLVVDPARRVGCECKTDEQVVVEPDGYRWANGEGALGPGDCRGCEYEKEIGGTPCTVHRGAAAR